MSSNSCHVTEGEWKIIEQTKRENLGLFFICHASIQKKNLTYQQEH